MKLVGFDIFFVFFKLSVPPLSALSPWFVLGLQFPIRGLLFLVAVAAIVLASWTHRAKRQAWTVKSVTVAGGQVKYEGRSAAADSPWGPHRGWLVDTLGVDFFYRIESVGIRFSEEHPADEMARYLTGVPYLRRLSVWPVTEGLAIPEDAPGGLTDAGAAFLRGHCRSLKHLSVAASRLSDEAVRMLAEQPGLDALQVSRHPDFGGDSPVATLWNADGEPVQKLVKLPPIE